jgi:outer membrane protein assembly factor BamB
MPCLIHPHVRIHALLIVLAGVALVAGPAFGDWPQFLGPDRDGKVSEAELAVGPDAKLPAVWQKEIGIGYSSFAVRDGKVYTMGNNGAKDIVYCLDAETGKEIWTHTYPAKLGIGGFNGPRSTPAVDEENVYTLSFAGLLHCLDAEKGTVKWKVDLAKMGLKAPRWGFSGSPLLDGDLVLLEAGPVLAFKKADGQLAWRSQPKPAGYSSPITFTLDGNKVVAAFDAAGLSVVDHGTGRPLYNYVWKTPYGVNACTPMVIGNKVFITSGYRVGGALVELTGSGVREIWKSKALGAQCNNPVLVDGHLYGFDGNVGGRGKLKCVRLADGKEMWSVRGLGAGSLIVAGDKLVILGEKGQLILADPDTGQLKKIVERDILGGDYCWTPPVLADGKIYARNYIKSRSVSEIICIDPGK